MAQASAIGCLPWIGFEVQSPPEAVDLWVQRGVGGGETLKDGSWACGDLRGPAGTCVDLCLSPSLSAVIKGLLPSDSQGSWSRVGWGEGPGPLLGTSVGPGSALPSLTRPRVCPTLPGPHLESRSPGTPWGQQRLLWGVLELGARVSWGQ